MTPTLFTPALLIRRDLELFRHVRPTGLLLPRGLRIETWMRLGTLLGRFGRGLAWAIGDWLTYGEENYGEKYAQAMEATGYPVETLANWASVARRVAPSRRRESLSWSHHAEVASLPPADQEGWLMRAEAENWDRATLRLWLGKQRPVLPPACPPHRCACGVRWGEKDS